MKSLFKYLFITLIITSSYTIKSGTAQNPLSPQDLLSLERNFAYELSPNSSELIYILYTPRGANEKPGPAKREYFRMNLSSFETQPLFNDSIKGSSPQYSPDGSLIAFIRRNSDGYSQVWAMYNNTDDTIFQLTNSNSNITFFRWLPDGKGIAYLCQEPKTEKEKELKERGYDFIFYEENLKRNELFIAKHEQDFKNITTEQIIIDAHIWDFEFSKNGKWLAYSSSEQNLIDQRYMFRKINIINMETKNVEHKVGNTGKLGNYIFNDDGTTLAFSSALNINDHAVSQAFTYSLQEEKVKNHTPEKFKGHISWVGWKNNNELLCYCEEGVYPNLSTIKLKNSKKEIILDSKETKVIFSKPLHNEGNKLFVFTGNTSYDPSNIYSWNGKGDLTKITNLNSNLSEIEFGEQEVFNFEARDGKEIEGILIKPINYSQDSTYPTILYVHGGPESHHNNGWLSRYSTPGQVMAGKGYMVAYINYRASTGYGVDFGMEGLGDPAGKEFDDLADAIDYLVAEKGADRDRVGMAGGSYGGYASAWFATYYTDYVKAVCMFVGISNLISKRGTTDIPYEELLVHSGKPLEEQWQMNLERSPVYYAHKSKTATLIYGGASDPRVNPEQSLQLYRRMKMNDHPAVRLVQYPGEGHGNRKQVGQIDVLMRQIDWLDWYVKDLKPLNGPMPPLDISYKYGLDWEY